MVDTFLIEAKNIRKVYGFGEWETVALEDITLSIPSGQFMAIMGPSGSGKSTLLQILGLLDKQTSGTYKFDGIESNQYSEYQLARLRNEKIGFVFQSFNLLPKTSVYENVMLPLVYSKIPIAQWPDRVTKAIDAVELSHRAQHESGMLSGGEKQRCAIARAFVTNPLIIFADEPTGNLDSTSGKTIMRILQTLHREGHTVVLITHEHQIAEYAQRIVTIQDGRLKEDK